MKIVHALAYYGDYLGGIQRYVRELAKRQKAEGHEVKIITSDLYGNQKQIDGVPIIRCKSWFSAFRLLFVPSLLIKLLNEDIKKTSLKNKEIDLTLMINVLEHVPNPEKALKELRRISKYVIFKVPLEDNLFFNILNFITFKKIRKELIENLGHINVSRTPSQRLGA